MLDAYPDAESPKPYTCKLCEQKCSAIIDDKYCTKCWNDMKIAQQIFGDDDHSLLDYMVTSAGSVGYAPNSCERCGKRFRFWRKANLVYDRKAHKFHSWKQVCIDCIKETDAI